MRHNNTTILAISRTPNPTKFQKTLGLNDFYFGADDWNFPLGHIQMVGKSDGAQIHGEGLPEFLQWFPTKPFDWLAEHSIDFWLTSEDLPLPQNRIFYDGDRVNLDSDAHKSGSAPAAARHPRIFADFAEGERDHSNELRSDWRRLYRDKAGCF